MANEAGNGTKYNLKSPAVKRLMREAAELKDAAYDYSAQPLEDNLFEWHFTVRGPADTDFETGIYHGRILLPPEYPMKPPSIILLTPNGRFEVHKKICLSISGYHPESWQPSWSIRTALLAIIGFMPSPGQGAIGSLDYPPEERRKLAQKSQGWCCDVCGNIKELLRSEPMLNDDGETASEAREIARQMSMKGEPNTGQNEAQHVAGSSVENEQLEAGSDARSSVEDELDATAIHISPEVANSEVRHRNIIHVPQPIVVEQVQEVISRQIRSRASDAGLWLIAAIILILLFRRFFLLEGKDYETFS